MTKRFFLNILIILGLSAVILYLLDVFSAHTSYSKLRDKANSPLYQLVTVGSEEKKFLVEVKASWEVYYSENPDEMWEEMCETIEFEPTCSGLVESFTHEIPPFSFTDSERNLREAGRAGAFSVALDKPPFSLTDRIFQGEGFAYLYLDEKIVFYFEDTDLGLKHVVYKRVD